MLDPHAIHVPSQEQFVSCCIFAGLGGWIRVDAGTRTLTNRLEHLARTLVVESL